MIAVNDQQDTYFKNFAGLERRRARMDPAWLRKIRKAAIDRFAELGFPNSHNEEWKYTSVAPLARIPFRPAADYLPPVNARQPKEPLRPYLEDCIPLHFYNGQFVEELTPTDTLPAGVKLTSLAKAFSAGSERLEKHFARYANFQKQSFVALNTAFVEYGALIEIAKDIVLNRPIYLRFLAGPTTAPIVYHPRVLILLGQGSQAIIVEQYLSANQNDESLYFTNAVTEVVLDEN